MTIPKLKPCPACQGPATYTKSCEDDGPVTCENRNCAVGETNTDFGYTVEKWESFPRGPEAPVGMSDGELLARAILVNYFMTHGVSARNLDRALDVELDRRVAARKGE